MRRPARARAAGKTAALAATVLLLLVSTACGGDDDPGQADDDGQQTTEAAPSSVVTSDQPTATSGSSTGTTSAPGTATTTTAAPTTSSSGTTTAPSEPPTSAGSVDDSKPSRARKAQIPARRLPGLNDQWTWQRAAAGPAAGKPSPGVCLQASLLAIGGVSEYRTDFATTLDERSSATQLTAVFPDEQTAVNSESVLAKWQEKCKRHAVADLGFERVRTTPPTEVETAVGPAPGWLVTYKPVPGEPRESWFGAEGYVRDGDTITYLVITTAGQDYNYEPGQQPIELALGEAGRMLARTR